jgi:hypothetical protein
MPLPGIELRFPGLQFSVQITILSDLSRLHKDDDFVIYGLFNDAHSSLGYLRSKRDN